MILWWRQFLPAGYLVPEDLLTADLRAFVRFAYMELLFWALQFAVLLVWLLIFPILSVPFQLLSSVVWGRAHREIGGFGLQHLGRITYWSPSFGFRLSYTPRPSREC